MLVRPNLWILPANIDLVGAESELVSVVGREIILREALSVVQGAFDYCLIDCAPSLGLLTLNALAAADEVLIPLQPHFLALQGFGKLLQTIELVNRRINPTLRVTGILLCMFDTRASLPKEVRNDIVQFLDNARDGDSAWSQAQILPTFIRRNIKLAEAPSYGRTIFEYDSDCHGAQDYLQVARFIAEMGQDRAGESGPVEDASPPVQAPVVVEALPPRPKRQKKVESMPTESTRDGFREPPHETQTGTAPESKQAAPSHLTPYGNPFRLDEAGEPGRAG